jgi:hypothetical protein
LRQVIVTALRWSRWFGVLASTALLAGCFNSLDWREFRSTEGRFTVTLPGKVLHDKRELTTPAGTLSMHMDSVSVGKSIFGVGYADYPPGYLTPARANTVISGLRDALVKNIGGGKIIEVPISGKPYQGISVHADGGQGEHKLILDARLLVFGDRLYQVVAIGEGGKGRIDRDALDLFFNSFRMTG